jgi:hypothetical protein
MNKQRVEKLRFHIIMIMVWKMKEGRCFKSCLTHYADSLWTLNHLSALKGHVQTYICCGD